MSSAQVPKVNCEGEGGLLGRLRSWAEGPTAPFVSPASAASPAESGRTEACINGVLDQPVPALVTYPSPT
jgi:hypothetical protein